MEGVLKQIEQSIQVGLIIIIFLSFNYLEEGVVVGSANFKYNY